MENQQKTVSNTWTEINKSLEERFPGAFKVQADDADDAAAYTKGFALADLLFIGPESLTPNKSSRCRLVSGRPQSQSSHLSDIQRVQLHALARLKMANHDRKVAALTKANARIKELETALAEYESSEPQAGKAGEGAPSTTSKDWLETAEDELRALDK